MGQKPICGNVRAQNGAKPLPIGLVIAAKVVAKQWGFSGGKDSVVIKALADMAGVRYEAHYSLTTVDPPELVRFIKSVPNIIIDRPKESMWRLIVRMGTPPTRLARYCCKELKEASGVGSVTITGVRWAESNNRKNNRHLVDIGDKKTGLVLNDDNDESRRTVEQCYRTRKTLVNPIIDWEDGDVWEFIRKYNVPYCSLYDEGFKRLGCIGCPNNTKREEDFERYPTYKRAYLRAFEKMIKKREDEGKPFHHWKTAEDVMEWWVRERKDREENPEQWEIEDTGAINEYPD